MKDPYGINRDGNGKPIPTVPGGFAGDTPRTDARVEIQQKYSSKGEWRGSAEMVPADIARQLERELIAAQQQLTEAQELFMDQVVHTQRIKDAGIAVAKYQEKRAEQAESKLAATSEALDWKPIETAPKEHGKHILLFGDGPGVEDCAYVGYFTEKWGPEEWRELTGRDVMRPTHWMPLPNVPEQRIESQRGKK